MPIYEYRCESCEHDFEELVFSTTASVPCPSCGSEDVARKLSVFAFRSTGSDRPSASSAHSSCGSCHSGNCSGCSCH